ncbi:DMT family transporter [Rugosimonospora africana]|uniref:Membrane protein n=1 Tax=Rugosimonospora africana TaxID=556532 RepID=A0A8J3QX48_9ACTN|nr:DMT family transporter [Rugosimonospora africana]GIH16326.1 membrane protein [Rugosimonospora africana]
MNGRFLALAGTLGGTVVLWASAFPAIRVGVDGLGVAGLSLARLAVASAALALAAPVLKIRLPRRRDLPLIVLCGATGMAAYQLLLNWGEVHVAAGTASLLVSVAPVFSVILATVLLGEHLTRYTVLGSLVAIAGAAVITLSGDGPVRLSASAVAVLGAALVQGVYHFASKPLLRRYSGREVASYAMWTGTLLLVPLAPETARAVASAAAAATLAAGYLGLLPSALGFVSWGYAVARLPLAASTAALYLVPPVALAVAYVWLGEVPHPAELLGGAISICGVVLIHRRRPVLDRSGSARLPPRHGPDQSPARAAPAPTVGVPAGLPGSMRGQSEV